jgi:predicted nucleotidyltransferase
VCENGKNSGKKDENGIISRIVTTFASQKGKKMSTQTMTKIIADYFKTQPVLKAWLFGSYARGEETPESDVDILVEFDHSSPIGLFAYARMWRELQERLGLDVDLVEEGTLRPFAVESANRDKKLIYIK